MQATPRSHSQTLEGLGEPILGLSNVDVVIQREFAIEPLRGRDTTGGRSIGNLRTTRGHSTPSSVHGPARSVVVSGPPTRCCGRNCLSCNYPPSREQRTTYRLQEPRRSWRCISSQWQQREGRQTLQCRSGDRILSRLARRNVWDPPFPGGDVF